MSSFAYVEMWTNVCRLGNFKVSRFVKDRRLFNVFHARALYYTKTLITKKMHKEFYHQL
jgi:hypothetical protein